MTTTPTDPEIETVAKAFIARELGDPDMILHFDNTPMWHAWREDARAAIVALDALRAGSVSDALTPRRPAMTKATDDVRAETPLERLRRLKMEHNIGQPWGEADEYWLLSRRNLQPCPASLDLDEIDRDVDIDFVSAIAAEIMDLPWAAGGDVDEHCSRHGDVQNAILAALRADLTPPDPSERLAPEINRLIGTYLTHYMPERHRAELVKAIIAALRADQKPQAGGAVEVPEGYVLVPREPTTEMIAAVRKNILGRRALGNNEEPTDAEVYRTMLAAAPSPAPKHQAGDAVERVRHVKRGTEYDVLGEAEGQISEGMKRYGASGATRLVSEGDMLVVYRGHDGKLWWRFPDEFRDGRFVPAAPSPAPKGEV